MPYSLNTSEVMSKRHTPPSGVGATRALPRAQEGKPWPNSVGDVSFMASRSKLHASLSSAGYWTPTMGASLCLQPEALLLQLRDPLANLSSPAHVLASMIARGLF